MAQSGSHHQKAKGFGEKMNITSLLAGFFIAVSGVPLDAAGQIQRRDDPFLIGSKAGAQGEV